ncbi:hypothetical protein ACJMK2_014136, partial [Sinanodonta woodiana]
MMRMNLKILMNYSPCKVCADTIEEFTKKTKKYCETNISITFGIFYKVYTEKDDNINIEGLAKLRNAGIKLGLVWDSKHLKEIIEKMGTKEEREAREKRDR